MKLVGEQLETWAHNQSNAHNRDLFGRSAFNRYYYATYLITREMLGDYNPQWKSTPHGSIPGLLEGAVKKSIIRQLQSSHKNGIINFGDMQRIRQQLQHATSDLANLLRNAYDARIIADYDPETTILTTGKVLSLKSYKLNSANSWSDRASAYCKVIRRVWRDAGLA